ncbi:phytanoyl-CoA dioxygenase family protein [[Leptolyngbya] sp. PCC 7376]|uniref:phytanoyl-CoA dioxygenase family protein n=1 Tax=[Leptolyngbya] sp. PCC 7376 TaxID=111781 RepID=UPI001C1E77C7|nr:phytanoyl-CoA dioxygenase family protein [[Leptolyngbya] sp. PCC 7376]
MCLLLAGVIYFKIWKKTPHKSYIAMRKLFVLSDGRFNDCISTIQKIRHPKYTNIIPNGILGNLSNENIKSIAAQIKKDGYFISSQKLDQNTIDRIIYFSKNTPLSHLKISSQEHQILSDKKSLFNSKIPLSPIYRFNMQQIYENSDLLDLILDQSLLSVAQEYLGCSPVLDLYSLWWSAPFNGKGTSEAAQEFHFDMDHIKFLKIFIYLTDVNTNNGPHCYVKKSHIRKPKSLLSEGRKSDEFIQSHYPKSCIHELCAPKGTIIFADTRGFHKGKALNEGNRLLFQIEFSNSLFGENYKKVKYKHDYQHSNLNKLLKKYPRTYSQIFTEVSSQR